MPETIQPGESDFRGYVTTSAPGPSLLDHLSEALTQGAQLAGKVHALHEKKALDKATDLLASPLITQAEIDELKASTSSPLIRMKAENASGGLVVEENIGALIAKVEQAQDPLTAREIFREGQAALLEANPSPGVQAGIRERFAMHAPKYLAAAAVRRGEKLKRDEQLTVAKDLEIAYGRSPMDFTEILIDHAEGAQLSGQDMDEFHTNAGATLLNAWRSGDDGLKNNPDSPSVLETIDLTLANIPGMSPKQRAVYTGLREQIESDEEQRLGDPTKAYEKAQKAAYLADLKVASQWKADNPMLAFPDAWAKTMRERATGPSELRALDSMLTDADAKLPGVTGAPEYKQARALLKSTLVTSAGILADEGSQVMELFDGVAHNLDASMKQDPAELRRVLAEVGKNAKARQLEMAVEEDKKLTAFNEKITGFQAARSTAEAAGDRQALAIADGDIRYEYDQRAKHIAKQYRGEIQNLMLESGITQDIIDTLP